IAFLAAAFVAILAGASIGAMGMLRTLQGATDFKPECAGGVQGGPQVGQARSNWRASEAPVRYSNGQNMMSITEMESAGFAGWSHRRALSGLYSDNLGYGWKLTGLMQLVQSGGQINVIDGATSVRSFLDNGNGTYTPLVWYQDTLVSDAVNHLLTLTDV